MVLRRNIYKGAYVQHGDGFGTVLSTVVRFLLPFLKRGARAAIRSPTVRTAVKGAISSAKKAAIRTGSDAAVDIYEGRNPKAKAKINLKRAKEGIERAFTQAVEGSNQPAIKKAKRTKQKKHPNRIARHKPLL